MTQSPAEEVHMTQSPGFVQVDNSLVCNTRISVVSNSILKLSLRHIATHYSVLVFIS